MTNNHRSSLSTTRHGQTASAILHLDDYLPASTKALDTPTKDTPLRSTYTPTSPSSNNNASTSASVPVPPELEQTLGTLTSHRSVLGYLLIARGGPSSASIIRNSGVVFEGEKGRKYAGVIAKIVESVQAGLEEVNNGSGVEDSSETDEVRFMRIRTKRHEIMISPNEQYLLAVLHDPTVT